MNLKYVFWGLVSSATVLFSVIYATRENYLLAALALGLGGVWLAADAKIEGNLGTLFFLAFVGLAVIASTYDALIPLTLLGMSANLAAWDISRFRARLSGKNDRGTRPRLETRHLRLLAVITGSGFLIALLPLFFRVSLPFVIVFGIALLGLLALRWSMHNLWVDRNGFR